MYNRNKILSIVLIVFVTSSGFLPGILPNLTNHERKLNQNELPLIVMFGYTQAEITARDNFLGNFPNSKVIDFAQNAQILSHQGAVIYVGHSSEQGILYSSRLVSWNTIKDIILNSKSEDHFILGCNSETISMLTQHSGKNVHSFSTEIDAVLGVNVISFQIARILSLSNKIQMKFLSHLINRLFDLAMNPQNAMPMRFGGSETVSIGVIGFSIFLTLFPLTSVVVALSAAAFATGLLAIVYYIYKFVNIVLDVLNGRSFDSAGAVDALWKIITGIIGVAKLYISRMSWWQQPFAYASLSADTVKNAIATLATVFICAFALAVLMWYLITFVYDFIDYDLDLG